MCFVVSESLHLKGKVGWLSQGVVRSRETSEELDVSLFFSVVAIRVCLDTGAPVGAGVAAEREDDERVSAWIVYDHFRHNAVVVFLSLF